MKKINVREIILVVAIIAMLCSIATSSLATDVNDIIQNITELEDNNVVSNNANTATPTNNTTNNTVKNTAINTIGTTNTSNTAKNTNTLPKTGVDDTMMWVLIGVSAIAAIYTYKKVRDYNV